MIVVQGNSSALSAQLAQMNGSVYVVDGNRNRVAVQAEAGSSDIVQGDVGLIEPSCAPHAQQARVHGNMSPNVRYKYRYTYYDSKRDIESNPSPESNVATTLGTYNGKIKSATTGYSSVIIYIDASSEVASGLHAGYTFFFNAVIKDNSEKLQSKKWYARVISSSTFYKDTLAYGITLAKIDTPVGEFDPIFNTYNTGTFLAGATFYIKAGDFTSGTIGDKSAIAAPIKPKKIGKNPTEEEKKKYAEELSAYMRFSQYAGNNWIRLDASDPSDYAFCRITFIDIAGSTGKVKKKGGKKKTIEEETDASDVADIFDAATITSRWIIDYNKDDRMARMDRPLPKPASVGGAYIIEDTLSGSTSRVPGTVSKTANKATHAADKKDTVVLIANKSASTTLDATKSWYIMFKNQPKVSGLYQVTRVVSDTGDGNAVGTLANYDGTDNESYLAVEVSGLKSSPEGLRVGKSLETDNTKPAWDYVLVDMNALTDETANKPYCAMTIDGFVPTSETGVDKFRLYRANSNGLQYALCSEIDATATKVIDKKSDFALNQLMEYDHTVPVPSAMIDRAYGRMWYAGGPSLALTGNFYKNSVLLFLNGGAGLSTLTTRHTNLRAVMGTLTYQARAKRVIDTPYSAQFNSLTSSAKQESVKVDASASIQAMSEFTAELWFKLPSNFTPNTTNFYLFQKRTASTDTYTTLSVYIYNGKAYVKAKTYDQSATTKEITGTLDTDPTGEQLATNVWHRLVFGFRAVTSDTGTSPAAGELFSLLDDAFGGEETRTTGDAGGLLHANLKTDESEYLLFNDPDNGAYAWQLGAFTLIDSGDVSTGEIICLLVPSLSKDASGGRISDMSGKGNHGMMVSDTPSAMFVAGFNPFSSTKIVVTDSLITVDNQIASPVTISMSSVVSEVRYSKLSEPEYVPSTFTILTGFNDGRPVTGLKQHKNKIYVFKDRSVSTIIPTEGDGVAEQMVARGIGCVGPRALCDTGRHLFWMDRYGVYRWTEGGNLDNISQPVARWWLGDDPYFNIDPDTLDKCICHHDPERNIVLFFVNWTSNGFTDAIVFDQNKTDNDSFFTWYRWTFTSIFVSSVFLFNDSTGARRTCIGDLVGNLYTLENDGLLDYVTWQLVFKNTPMGKVNETKRFHYMTLTHKPQTSSAPYTVSHRVDFGAWVTSGTADALLSSDRVNIGSRGVFLQTKATGTNPMRITGFGYEARPKGDKPREWS